MQYISELALIIAVIKEKKMSTNNGFIPYKNQQRLHISIRMALVKSKIFNILFTQLNLPHMYNV